MNDIANALSDPEFYVTGNPHPIWLQMRREDPVHWTVGRLTRGFWSATRYADAVAVYSDPHTFCSAKGVTLPSSRDMEQIAPIQEWMVHADPPLHGAMRRAFNSHFLPRSMESFKVAGPKLIDDILKDVLPRGRCDFVIDVAAKLPMAFICEMMRIPPEDWAAMFAWANMALGFEDSEYQVGSGAETQQFGLRKASEYCMRLALERRGGDGGDLLSIIGNAEVNGRKLSDGELGYNGTMFVNGGLETTRNAIAGGLLALIEHPDQRERLISQPGLITSAIEEILRWTSPVTHLMRTATHDTEVGGKKIRKGDRVVVWNASANRDEEVFDNPYSFDITRDPNEHLAFGKGEHFCIGAHLARLELRLMLTAVLKRMANIELAGKVERLRSHSLAGIKHMPINFVPASRNVKSECELSDG